MQFRPFGKTDFQVSALGFGCMRLPTVPGKTGADIDEPLAIEMLRHAIDEGVNYVDSAHGYHGGNSEKVLGKALAGGCREKVRVATKLPLWDIKEAADFDRLLDEQRTRLQIDHVDVYLLHNINRNVWPKMRDLGVCDWLTKMQAEGKVGQIGFSFHDAPPLLREMLEFFDGWDVCQIQYNYVNERVQAGTEGLKLAAEAGLAVVVMEPLLGGCLVEPPRAVQDVFAAAETPRTPADWALQWLWDKPEVATVLSGMSTMEHVQQNLASAAASGIGSFTDADRATIAAAQAASEGLQAVGCTRCGYCMPCPNGVDIPTNFQLMNDAKTFGPGHYGLNRNLYNDMAEPRRGGSCVDCGECLPKCPQEIAIPQQLQAVHEYFTKKDTNA